MKILRKLAMPVVLAAAMQLAALTPGYSSRANAEDVDPVYRDMIIGNEDAEVVVIEYASFTCPHCAFFHKNAFEELKVNYIDTGKISFEMREVYFDRLGLWAGITARCGGGSKYFAIVDLLFDKQDEWAGGLDALSIANRLKAIGVAVGLEPDVIDACFRDGGKAVMLRDTSMEFTARDGISSTPTFVINGKRYGNMPYEEFARILDEELSE